MSGKIKKVFFVSLYFSGISRVIRFLFQRNKVSILLLHNIDFARADELFAKLTKKYNFISLSDYTSILEGNVESKQKFLGLRYKAILTFDDGYKENYQLLPLFKKYNIPATIFLCSSIIGTNKHYWSTYHSPDISMNEVKKKSHDEMMGHFKSLGYSKDSEYELRQSLDLKEINEMQQSRLVDFQSHTMYHPILTKLDDTSSYKEIKESKQELESKIQAAKIESFAFPNGDYGKRELEYVEKVGYKSSCTVDFGYNDEQSNPFKLMRICLNDTGTLYENLIKATGLWDMIKKFI